MIKEIINKLINRNKKFIEDSIIYENKYSFLNTKAHNEELEYEAKQAFIKANYPVDYEDYLKALEEPNLNNKLNQYFRFFCELYNNEEIDGELFLQLIDHKAMYYMNNEVFLVKKSLYDIRYAELTKYKNKRFNDNICYEMAIKILFHYATQDDRFLDNYDIETKVNNLSIIFEGLNEEDKFKFLNIIEENHNKEDNIQLKTYLMLKLKGKLQEKNEPKKKVIKI